MSSRYLNNWLAAYLKYTDGTEPPTSYHTWTAIAMIAGALQRKVYLPWGHEKIYPNMFLVLVGPSGKCRKGTAMNIGKEIVKDVNIPLVSESIIREALIKRMGDSVNNFTDPDDGDIKFHCSLMCMSDELSVFLGQHDVKFLADLTDWYDSRDEWKYETKNSGSDRIQGVCFTLLGATAPDWLCSILPDEAIGGGFTSRIIFIVEEDKRKIVSKPVYTDEHKKLKEALVKDLEKIHTMCGAFQFHPKAETLYVKWYEQEEKKARAGNPAIPDPRFAGYCDRRATHIRKLSMIVSAAKNDERIITEEDFEDARKLLEAAEIRMHKTFSGIGSASYSAVIEKILDYIIIRNKVKRSELLKQFYKDVDSAMLKNVEEVLSQMKLIEIRLQPGSGDCEYVYIGPR